MPNKTPREYATDYNVSLRTVQRWIARDWPVDDPAAIAVKLRTQKHLPKSHESPAALSGKDRKLELECERLAFKLAVDKGEYTANSLIREDITRIATATRSALMRLESELPSELAGLDSPAIQQIVRRHIDKIITDLSDVLSALYRLPDGVTVS